MKPTVLDQLLENWKIALHQQGYRVTQPRLQVMEILASSETPLTPQDIYQRSLEMDSPPGIASVYRTLEMMDELGLIQQIHQPGGCHAIWPALEGHQHLLICTRCGQMRIVDGNEDISAYLRDIEQQTGYQVDEHWLQLFGVCQDCS
jgi:Fur family transcriptional regulator, ferric uptake regulator